MRLTLMFTAIALAALALAAVLELAAPDVSAQESSLGDSARMPKIVGNEHPRDDWGGTFGDVGMTGQTAAADVFTVTVVRHDTWDPRGVQFYELRFASGGSATISVDADVRLAKTLERLAQRPRVRLVLEPLDLQTLEGRHP